MADGVNKFLGDTPARTIVKLIVVCLIVGFVLHIWGFRPQTILGDIREFFQNIVSQGFQAFGDVGTYLVLGAIIVIPIFVILRLMSYRR